MSRVRHTYVRPHSRLVIALFSVFAFLTAAQSARAQSYTVLSDFGQQAEGWTPRTGVVKASDGNFYGTTANGGFGYGTLFKITPSGTLTTVYRFNYTDGADPESRLIQASDGFLYGTTNSGGGFGGGTIFRFDRSTLTLTTAYSFNASTEGSSPEGGIIQGTDGAFYGTTVYGGTAGLGTIYRWTPSPTSTLTTLHSLAPYDSSSGTYPEGYYPHAGLVEASPGVFYGAATAGGLAGGYGTVFKYVAATSAFTMVHAFDGTDGSGPWASLTKGSDGRLYGVTIGGGPSGYGTVYRWNPSAAAGSEFTSLYVLDYTGYYPVAPLTQGTDGKFYGTTVYGGAASRGTIFRFAPGDPSVTVLCEFASTGGVNPYGGLAEGTAGTFYGTTSASGSGGSSGTVFKLTTSGAPALVTLHEFEGSPANPDSPLVQAADGTLYGTTRSGGTAGYGTLFKVTPAGVITPLYSFNYSDGATPSGDLLLDPVAGVLYGTTAHGGVSGCGTIYKLVLTTEALTTEQSFDYAAQGCNPQGGLIKASDGLFYGTTTSGTAGAEGGTVYKWDPNPAASPRLTVLKGFTYDGTTGIYPDGNYPYGGLVEGVPGTFYGVTERGGAANSYGVLFRITSTGAFTKLHEFTYDTAAGIYPTGDYPAAGLVKAADGNFYGSTVGGGLVGYGTLFKLTPAGAFSVAHDFGYADGTGPYARLVSSPDGNLYGSTSAGGDNGTGLIFRFDPVSSAFAPVHSLAAYDSTLAAYPEGYTITQAVLLGSDGMWYGTTDQGGKASRGVVFRLDPPPTVKVLRANGAEKLFTGTPYVIQWTAADNQPLASFDVFFSTDGGTTFGTTPICSGVSGAARSCTWSTPIATTQGRFRIVAHDSVGGTMADDSDGNFTVEAGAGTITVTSPTTAVSWNVGSTQTITWTHNLGAVSNVNIGVSRDGGSTYTAIASDIANTGNYPWSVTGPATAQARIRVTWVNGPTVTDQSDVNFTISTVTGPSCCITVTQPTKKKLEYGIGSTQQIKWTHTLGAGTSVKIELSRDGGVTYPETIAASVANTSATAGLYNWLVTSPATANARIRVTAVVGTATDSSDVNFGIAPAYIKLSGPPAGGSWGYGTVQNAAWTTNLGPLDKVDVQLSQDGGATFTKVASAAGKTSAKVNAPTLTSPISTARLRVVWTNPPAGFSAQDTNPGNFKIEPPFVTVTAPNGGEVWAVGSKQTFAWANNLGSLEKVNVQLSKDGGATFATIVLSNTPSDGAQKVALQSGWVTTSGRIRVVWAKNPSVADSSDANFRIQ